MSGTHSEDQDIPQRTIVMSDAINNSAKSSANSDSEQEKTQQLKPRTTTGFKNNSRITGWLMHFYSTVSGDTSESLDDNSKVSLDTLAEINAAPDICESYENLDDNFVMQKEIARGGQGIIARAFDKHCSRTVAVKSLHQQLAESDKARKLFLTEAQITAQLEHPSIIPIYGIFGDKGNGLHIAMKMVHGKSLQQYLNFIIKIYDSNSPKYIKKNEAENLKKRLGYFLNVVEAIAYVHHKKIIHKDLKPENIMIGAFGETYVMDWGISEKVVTQNIAKKPSGTLQYMAPEVINGEPYDTRSDIYLLGLILFEIAFLKPAYKSKTTDEAIKIAKEAIISTPVHRFGCHVDNDLRYIIEKALAINPNDRYQTAEQLGKDVRAFLQGDIVSASPYQTMELIFRFIRRNVKLVAILLTIVLAIFFGTNFFFISKALNDTREAIERKNLVTTLTNTSLKQADKFDHVINDYANHIRTIAMEAATRLENSKNLPQDVAIPEVFSKFGNTPPNLIFSPAYNNLSLSFDNIVYKFAPNAQPKNLNRTLASIAPMKNDFLRLILYSPSVITKTRRSYLSLLTITQQERPPLFCTYIGFINGLHISFPFKNDFPKDYDPRQKLWYTRTAHAGRGNIVIPDPYIDKGKNHELILTFASPVVDSNGKFYGVAAADILFERCQRLLENYRNTQHISRTMIIDKKGRIILDANFKPSISKDGNTPIFHDFKDKESFTEMLNMHGGVLFSSQNGLEYLYIFKHIAALDSFYVERINFTKLMQN